MASVSRPAALLPLNLRGRLEAVPVNGCLVPLTRGPVCEPLAGKPWHEPSRLRRLRKPRPGVEGNLRFPLTNSYHGRPAASTPGRRAWLDHGRTSARTPTLLETWCHGFATAGSGQGHSTALLITKELIGFVCSLFCFSGRGLLPEWLRHGVRSPGTALACDPYSRVIPPSKCFRGCGGVSG
jgi:hypothetical protein